MKKNKSATISAYRKWNTAKWTLWGSKYALPLVPAGVITAINWDEWFVHSGWSLPMGFASLLLSILATILAVSKKDKTTEEVISPIFKVALVMSIWAVTFMFLANVLQEMGQMFLWTTGGILASGIGDQVNKSIVEPTVKEYKSLIVDNNLDGKAKRHRERKLQAQSEAETMATE